MALKNSVSRCSNLFNDWSQFCFGQVHVLNFLIAHVAAENLDKFINRGSGFPGESGFRSEQTTCTEWNHLDCSQAIISASISLFSW